MTASNRKETENLSVIRALSRGLGVLQSIRTLGPSTLQEIHAATGLPKATLARIIATLEHEGYVRRGLGDGLYRISARTAQLSNPVGFPDLMAEVAGPYLDDLCSRVIWPSDLAVYSDGMMVIGETTRRQSPLLLNRHMTAPRIHMMVSALGRAYLANCSDEKRDEILARLRQSADRYDRLAADPTYVKRVIEQTRSQGYGIREVGYWARTPDQTIQLRTIAVPVRSQDQLFGCINLVWVHGTVTEADIVRDYLARLNETAGLIASEFSKRFQTLGVESALT